jgi:hypothetical protein
MQVTGQARRRTAINTRTTSTTLFVRLKVDVELSLGTREGLTGKL